ncbi:MAG: MotA/TolQ/ExbB proton channel family protein [Rhodobacteraceae bacterium]|nr:MotA/TolQ/ExbB proton channel family protein [Paracoccaceae bacterium]
MDLASIIGIIGAIGMIAGAMLAAGGLAPFIEVSSLLIVVGGSFFAVMLKSKLDVFLKSFGAMGKAFFAKKANLEELIETMGDLSDKARKNGLMALEGAEVHERFLSRGLQLLVDGTDEGHLISQLKQEIRGMRTRHNEIHDVLRGWVDIAPAMGMIGTLIGLVQMLGNMDDPKAIGPAMAVALLTTLYGAFLANVIFGPLLSKLESSTESEANYRELVIEGLRNIARGEPSRAVQEKMISSMPPKVQDKLVVA